MLLAGYIPFFILPLVMMFDMSFRVTALVKLGARVDAAKKRR